VLFYQAVVHALTGEPSNSLRYLSGAIENGFSLSEAVQDDDLESLKKIEEYELLMQRYQKEGS
jgi:hypothetical protein